MIDAPTGRRTGVLVAMLVALVTVAGCTVGPSERPPVAVRGGDLPRAEPPAPAQVSPELPEPRSGESTITFVECTETAIAAAGVTVAPDRELRADCGEVVVPVDGANPGQGPALIGVLRVGLADAQPDRPPLLVVDDSAGDPTALHAVRRAATLPPQVLERFTLVGIDRRGAGLDALGCAPVPALGAIVDADPAALPAEGLDALLEQARAVVAACTLTRTGAVGSYRSASSGADVEQVRVALGVDRLSALGTGDGAAALAHWARAAPQAVGRLVLDGPPDPDRTEPDAARGRAAAAEQALDAFAAACAARDGCPLDEDARAAVVELLADLREQPLVADDGSRLTAGAAVTALTVGLGDPSATDRLAGALAAARDGDPGGLLAVLDPLAGPDGTLLTAIATTCNDTSRRFSPPEVAELAAEWTAEFPVFGADAAHDLLTCAPWPSPAAAPPPDPAAGTPPILVLGTAADPRSPLTGSREAAESLAEALFVQWQGAGNGAYPRSPCVTELVTAMLVDGEPPTSGTVCPP